MQAPSSHADLAAAKRASDIAAADRLLMLVAGVEDSSEMTPEASLSHPAAAPAPPGVTAPAPRASPLKAGIYLGKSRSLAVDVGTGQGGVPVVRRKNFGWKVAAGADWLNKRGMWIKPTESLLAKN